MFLKDDNQIKDGTSLFFSLPKQSEVEDLSCLTRYRHRGGSCWSATTRCECSPKKVGILPPQKTPRFVSVRFRFFFFWFIVCPCLAGLVVLWRLKIGSLFGPEWVCLW